MSISSWLRMWQCQTYSQPKLTIWLVIGRSGSPLGSMLLKPHRGRTERHAWVRAADAVRHVEGHLRDDRPQRHDGVLERAYPDVSFQPSSLASGGDVPSQSTRLITCTSNRWKWIGWVSTPLCVIFQIWSVVEDEIGVISRLVVVPQTPRPPA